MLVFSSFSSADDMLVHVILIVGICYTRTTAQHAQNINIFFFIYEISWTDHVRSEEVLLRVNEQRNILHEIRKRKAN